MLEKVSQPWDMTITETAHPCEEKNGEDVLLN
jgi:hypothetical protein